MNKDTICFDQHFSNESIIGKMEEAYSTVLKVKNYSPRTISDMDGILGARGMK